MNERRAEQRFMCSDLVKVELEHHDQLLVANLEDISPSGACLELNQPVPPDATVVLKCSDCQFSGKVRYCVFDRGGYQVGLRFTECKWSKLKYTPRHLLEGSMVQALDRAPILQQDAGMSRLLADLAAARPELVQCAPDLQTGQARPARSRPCCDEESCTRADISRLIEPESPLPERVRVVGRAIAWTCEKLSPEDLERCFSRWFQLPPECTLCDEFARAYQDEYVAISSQPASGKVRAAGGTSNGF